VRPTGECPQSLADADLDVPSDQLCLWIQAATGTEYDFVFRQVKRQRLLLQSTVFSLRRASS